ncbi:cobalamin-binding protein [Pontibacillus salicampi]|uniref:Cobalamin-binding protein n=1 Tax=Pontibacillus salicampi TaxID=1449801 RepID=A0ABV6LM95_9BACI
MRIVSICPSNTELAAYLGLTEQLVGVDNFSDWPSSVLTLPRLGPDLSIDMDKVEALQPDLVLASLSVPGMERNIEGLQERNLPYIILNPHSLQGIAEDLITVGEHTGTEAQAARVVSQFQSILKQYEEIAQSIADKPRIYWEWWPKPIFTPGGGNWLTEISYLAGAKNIFASEEEASLQTEWEKVVEQEPDVICMVWVGVAEKKMRPELIQKRDGWNRLDEKHTTIHTLEESLYCRPSPRLLYGLQKLAYLLHPDRYPTYPNTDVLLELG